MENMKRNIILFLLILNALFWGLFPHSEHCKVFNYLNKITKLSMECPSHKIHIIMGFIFYTLSVYYTQHNSFK